MCWQFFQHIIYLLWYSTQKWKFCLHFLAFMSFQTCFFHLWNSKNIMKNVGNPTKLEPIDFYCTMLTKKKKKTAWNMFQNCMTLNIIQVCALWQNSHFDVEYYFKPMWKHNSNAINVSVAIYFCIELQQIKFTFTHWPDVQIVYVLSK